MSPEPAWSLEAMFRQQRALAERAERWYAPSVSAAEHDPVDPAPAGATEPPDDTSPTMTDAPEPADPMADTVAGDASPADGEPSGSGELEPGKSSPAPVVELPDPYGMVGERQCPMCGGDGAIPWALKQSPRYQTCEECGGVGMVMTGSLIEGKEAAPCEGCQGRGYREAAGPPLELTPAYVPGGPQTDPPWPGAEWDASRGQWV